MTRTKTLHAKSMKQVLASLYKLLTDVYLFLPLRGLRVLEVNRMIVFYLCLLAIIGLPAICGATLYVELSHLDKVRN